MNQDCGHPTNFMNSYNHWARNSFPPVYVPRGEMAMQRGASAPSKKGQGNSSCKRNWLRWIFHKRTQSVNIRLRIFTGRTNVCNPNPASIRPSTVLAKLCVTLRIRQQNLSASRENTRKSNAQITRKTRIGRTRINPECPKPSNWVKSWLIANYN